MLDFVTSGDIYWNRFWLSLHHEVETYHVRSPENDHILRPGELAHAKGVVIQDFFRFLEQKGYTLNERERKTYHLGSMAAAESGKTAKPCIVLDRLGDGWYRICHLSSFGGNIRPEQILNPMMRYFGFSMVKGEWPPGEKLLGVSPGMTKTVYATMLPFVTKDVVPMDWRVRAFLKVGQLERLKKLAEVRAKSFDSVSEILRSANLDSRQRLSMIKKQPKEMQGLLTGPPYSRKQLRSQDYYIEALRPGFRLSLLVKEGLRSDQEKPARVLGHKPPRLPVRRPNFIRHFHRRTIDEVIGREVPLFQQLQTIDIRKFRLPRMLK